MIITDSQLIEFKKTGVLLIEGFYSYEDEVKPIQKQIYKIIGLIIDKYKLEISRDAFRGDNFDVGLVELAQSNRKYIGEVYDAIKQIPAFLRLLSAEKNEQLVRKVLDSDSCGIAAGGYGIRIDLPGEEQYRTLWHQEYPAQLRSMTGVVLWSPLVEILSNMGAVEVFLESHQEGVLPVYEDNSSSRTGAYSLRLKDEEKVISKYVKTAPLSKSGDLIIMDWLVVHQSGYNVSDKARWSMQMRYFNFLDPVGKKISWKGSYADGVNFKDIHPELFAQKD